MRLFMGLTLVSMMATTLPNGVVSRPPRAHGVPPRALIIAGVIRDFATRGPVPLVTIAYGRGNPADASFSASGQVASDAQGRYRLAISLSDSATTVPLRVTRIGYAMASIVAMVPRSSDSITVDFTLSAATMTLSAVSGSATSDPSIASRSPMTVTRLDAEQMPVPSFANGAMRVSGKVAGVTSMSGGDPRAQSNTDEYAKIDDNGFTAVRDAPLSTFAADVDRAAYSNVRAFIRSGRLPPKDAVRIEELVNYFHYDYAQPRGSEPIAISTEAVQAPWNHQHQIVRVALQTAPIETAKLPRNNLVFLIDVSGSMYPAERLPLAQQAFRMLVEQLREEDRVAIVVYAGQAGLVLPSTPGSEKTTILDAINHLTAGGSTAGGAGIQLAYDVASKNFIQGGNNRVILATDGDFNVGLSNTADLVRFIEQRRGEGIALTALGFGMGNYKDNRIEQLADKGNGNYAYIDGLAEARKVFVHEMGATLVTVAKDVKLQVEFNPATVQAYRLIGYENRLLQARDFTDDKKDAGEMGAGHSVTALYEIVPIGTALDVETGNVPAMRYQTTNPAASSAGRRSELANVSVRYKLPASDTSQLLERVVAPVTSLSSDDMRFALAVAGYGMLLRDSPFKGALTYEDVLTLGRGAVGTDREHYRADFLDLVQATRALTVADQRRLH